MKIILATMVKDEVDIIEEWIIYHGKIFGYKNLFIVDNMSSDGTYNICKKYNSKYGVNIQKHEDYKEKGIIMTKIFNENKCDIFFPIDIDEFIVYYNRKKNKISIKNINKYIESLLVKKGNEFNYFKCDYLHPKKTINSNNPIKKFNHASLCDTYGDSRKTFIYNNLNNNLNNVKIDHGNHMASVKYFVCDLCLIHYHNRSHIQRYKKSINNTLGLGYTINIKKLENEDKNELEVLKNVFTNKNCPGGHHPKSLYSFFSGKIKSFEPRLEEIKNNFIDISKIYRFVKENQQK